MIAQISKAVLQRLSGIQTKIRLFQNSQQLKQKPEQTTQEINIWVKDLQVIDEKATKPTENLKNLNILIQFSKDVKQKLIESNVQSVKKNDIVDQDTKSLVLAGDPDSLKKIATAFSDLAQKYENLVFSVSDVNLNGNQQLKTDKNSQDAKNSGYQLPLEDYEDRLNNEEFEDLDKNQQKEDSIKFKNNSLPENKFSQPIQQNQFQHKAQSVKPSFESPFQDQKQIKSLPPRVPQQQQEQKKINKSFQETKKMQENLQKRVYEFIAQQIAQENELKQLFQIIKQSDKYQTGTISSIQLNFIINEIYGHILDRHVLDKLIDELSQEEKQEIDYTQFLNQISQIKVNENQQRLKSIFDQFDKDQNEKVSLQELSQALSYKNNDQMINQLINDMDQNGDSFISFNEFEQYVNQIALFSLGQAPSQFFRNQSKIDQSPQMSLQAIKIQKYIESLGNEINQMILPEFESSLELILVALQQSLLLQSKNQAAAFLTNNNRFLRLGCMNGLKGGEFKPLENWMMCLQVNALQLAKMLAQNPEQMVNIIKVLSCGFYAPRNISNYSKQYSQDKLIESLETLKRRSLLDRTVDLVVNLIKTLSRWSKGNIPHTILNPTQVKVKSADITLLKSFILNLIIDPSTNTQDKAQSPLRGNKKSSIKESKSPQRKASNTNEEQNLENFEIGELILSKEKLVYLVCMLYKDDLNQLVQIINSNHTKVWKHIFVAVVQNSCWFSQPYIMQSWLKAGMLGTFTNKIQNDRLIYSSELESQISVFKTVLTDVLDQFGHDQIDPRDQEVNTEIIATTWFLFPQLFSQDNQQQNNNKSFLDDFLLSNNDSSQFLNHAQNQNKRLIGKRANSPGLLGNQVIDFAVRALSKCCRSQNKAVSLYCIQMCFNLLNGLATSKNPHSAAIYKMMTFYFIENFQDDITREVMSQSFSNILRRHQSIPLNVLVEPFLRKIIQAFEFQPQLQNNQKNPESISYFQFFDEQLLFEIINHSKFMKRSSEDQIPLIIQFVEAFLQCLIETRIPFYIIGIRLILNKVLEENSDNLQNQVTEAERIMQSCQNTIEEISKTQIQAWTDNETLLEKVMLVKKIKIVLDFMVLISVQFNNSGKLVGTRFKNLLIEQSDNFEELKTKLLGKNRQNLKSLKITTSYQENDKPKLTNKQKHQNIIMNDSENFSEKPTQNQRVGGDVNRAQIMVMKIRAQTHIQRIKEEKDNKEKQQQLDLQQKKEKEDRLRQALDKNRKASVLQPHLFDYEEEQAVVSYQKQTVSQQKTKVNIDNRQLLTHVQIINLEDEELNEAEGVRLMISLNYKLIKSMFLKYAVNGAVANSLSRKSGSVNYGQKSGKNAYEEMIGERMINMREIFRFVKECCGFSSIAKTDIQYIVKHVNKVNGINDVLNMTLQQFSGDGPTNRGGFLLQLAYLVFQTDPTKCLEQLLKNIVSISEYGNSLPFNPYIPIEKDNHKIFQKDQKELSQLTEQQRNEIYELEKKVKGGANTYVLPSQYVTQKEFYQVKYYKIPLTLRQYMPEKQVIALELLDEILSQATKVHFIEPIVFFKQHIKVRPRVAQNKALVASAGTGQKRVASLTKLNNQEIKSQDVQKHRRALSANKEQPLQFQSHLKGNFSTNADSVSLQKRIEQFTNRIDNDPLYSNEDNETSTLIQKRQKKLNKSIKSLLPPKPIQPPKFQDLQQKLNQAEDELRKIQSQRPIELNPDLFIPHIQKDLLNQKSMKDADDNQNSNPYLIPVKANQNLIRNQAIADQLEKSAMEKVQKIEEEIRFLQRKEEAKIFKEIKQRKKEKRDHSKEINEKQQNEGLLKNQLDQLKNAYREVEMEKKKKLVEERLKKKEEERLKKLEEETEEKKHLKEEKAQSQKEFLEKQKQILQQQFQTFKQKKEQQESEKQQKEKAENQQGELLKEQVMKFHKVHKKSLIQKQEKDDEFFSNLLNDQQAAQVLDSHKFELIPIYKATAIQSKNFQLGTDLPLKTKIEVQLKNQGAIERQDSVAKKQKQLELLPNMNQTEFSKLMMQRGIVNSSKKTLNKKDIVEVFNYVKNEDQLDIDYFQFETALLRLFLIWQSKFDNFQPKANNKIISDHSDRVVHTCNSYQKNANVLFTDFDQFLNKFEKKSLGGYAQQFAFQSQDKQKVNEDLVWLKEKDEKEKKILIEQKSEIQKEQQELQQLQQKLETDPFLALSLGISSANRQNRVKSFRFTKEQKQQSPNIKGAAEWLEKKNSIVSKHSPKLIRSEKLNNSQSVQSLLRSSLKKQSPIKNSNKQVLLSNQLSPQRNSNPALIQQNSNSQQNNQIINSQANMNQNINLQNLNNPQRNQVQNINQQNLNSPQRNQAQNINQQNLNNTQRNQTQNINQQNLNSPQRNQNQVSPQQNILTGGRNQNQPQQLPNQNQQQNFNQQFQQQNFTSPQKNLNQSVNQQNLNTSTRNLNQQNQQSLNNSQIITNSGSALKTQLKELKNNSIVIDQISQSNQQSPNQLKGQYKSPYSQKKKAIQDNRPIFEKLNEQLGKDGTFKSNQEAFETLNQNQKTPPKKKWGQASPKKEEDQTKKSSPNINIKQNYATVARNNPHSLLEDQYSSQASRVNNLGIPSAKSISLQQAIGQNIGQQISVSSPQKNLENNSPGQQNRQSRK